MNETREVRRNKSRAGVTAEAPHRGNGPRRRRSDRSDRRGSVLVVILAMLGALMLLGFVFFTIAAQEEEAASLFADAQKEPTELGLTADELFDFALEQVVVGPANDRLNSALWGGRWSLMANLVGTDRQPYDGVGVNLVMDPTGGADLIGADQDFDGVIDFPGVANEPLFELNQSLSAQGDRAGTVIKTVDNTLNISNRATDPLPQPDVGYSYPDLNSPFLAYLGVEPTTGETVVIPSFHRPQYLRDTGEAFGDWYGTGPMPPTATDLTKLILRPHQEHLAYAWVDGDDNADGDADDDDDGTAEGELDGVVDADEAFTVNTGTRIEVENGLSVTGAEGGPVARFINATFTDTTTGVTYDPFPIVPADDLYGVTAAVDEDLAEGHWSNDPRVSDADPLTVGYQYDADPDGDGIFEAVWLDLDFPVQRTADGSQAFVPLFAITIYDLDGLLNLNAHGNLYGDIDLAAGEDFGNGASVSRSNEGRAPHEVNPTYALTADPSAATATHEDFFTPPPATAAAPVSTGALANMEWFWLLCGRGDFDTGAGTVEASYPGRWGRDGVLTFALQQISSAAGDASFFPRPGEANIDDDGDALYGSGLALAGDEDELTSFGRGVAFAASVLFPGFGEPADMLGSGRTTGFRNNFNAGSASGSPTALPSSPGDRATIVEDGSGVRYPYRLGYWTMTGFDWSRAFSASAVAGFPTGVGGFPTAVSTAATFPVGVLTTLEAFQSEYLLAFQNVSAPSDLRTTDEPSETLLGGGGEDQLFGADETASLHLTNADWASQGGSSRLRQLAPANLQDDVDADEIRRRLTTVSGDYDAFSFPQAVGAPTGVGAGSVRREWEFNARWTIDASGVVTGTAVAPTDPGEGEFPPVFNAGTDEPFRDEVVALLRTGPDDGLFGSPLGTDSREFQRLLRKLSVNHVAANLAGRFVQRPLTPHPETLGSAAVDGATLGLGTQFGIPDTATELANAYPIPGNGAGLPEERQEWHARRDRQNLARDIYVLLYTLSAQTDPTAGPPDAAMFPPGSSGLTVDEMLREMAQFAVNVVDRMDGDDVITAFVYDTDLSDGYTTTDDAYSSTTGFTSSQFGNTDIASTATVNWVGDDALLSTSGDARGVVFGVERQSLTLSEGLAIYCDDIEDSGDQYDHPLTSWDDTVEQVFTFVELKNVSPTEVRLEDRWQVVATVNTGRPARTEASGVLLANGVPRAVTFADAEHDLTGSVPANRTIVIAEAEHRDEEEVDPTALMLQANPPAVRSATATDAVVFAVTDGVSDATTLTGNPHSAVLTTNPYTYHVRGLIGAAVGPTLGDAEVLDLRGDQGAGPAAGFVLHDVTDNSTTSALNTTVDPDEALAWIDYASAPGGYGNLQTGSGSVLFELRRRINTVRTAPVASSATPNVSEENENPWITVDRLQIPVDTFDIDRAATQGVINVALEGLAAGERTDLLARTDSPLSSLLASVSTPSSTTDPGPGPNPDDAVARGRLAESIGEAFNGESVTPQRFYQPHGDRPFANLAELFDVPLYGPEDVTARFADGTAPDRRDTAAMRFLYPDAGTLAATGVAADGQIGGDLQYDNLWFRLLSFLEVPTGYGEVDGSDPHYLEPAGSVLGADDLERERSKSFGKVNLNMVRHPHVLAGLLDDPRFVDAGDPLASPATGLFATVPSLPSEIGEALESAVVTTDRDWWLTFLASRDGFDPVTTTQILPGLPPRIGLSNTAPDRFGRPFRTGGPLRGATGAGLTESLEDGFFRRLPFDLTPGGSPEVLPRGLFELGDANQADTALFNQDTRHHLLGKVLQNATTRTNAYVVFLQVDYFQAFENDHDGNADTPPLVQIGGRLDTSPGFRGVYVLDRTEALARLEEDHLPPDPASAPTAADPELRNFSFARGGDGEPLFPWRSLIKFERVLD